jgi:HemY protein
MLLRLALLTLNLPSIVRAPRAPRAAKKRAEKFFGGRKAYTE